MKKKKFLDGTRLDSQNESATKKVTAPGGAETGFMEIDGDDLASVAAGFWQYDYAAASDAAMRFAVSWFLDNYDKDTSD